MGKIQLSTASRAFIISSTVLLTVVLSVYFKNKTEKIFIDDMKNPHQTLLKKMPEFELVKTRDKTPFSSSSLKMTKNKLTIVHFWGTWCAPCDAELPSLLKLINDLKAYPVQFVFIAVKDKYKDIKKYLNRFPLFPDEIISLFDTSEQIMDSFGMTKVPETFVFEASTGKLLKHYVGPQNWNNIYYRQELLKL